VLVSIIACILVFSIILLYMTCKCAKKHTTDQHDTEHYPFLEPAAV